MIRLPSLGIDYYKYAVAATLASFASGVQFITISWFLYTTTQSAWSVGAAMILSTIPGILFSTWIGAFVDRRRPRNICGVTDFVRSAAWLVAAIATFAAHGSTVAIPVIYAALFVSATCDCFFQPAIGAMVRNVVQREKLLQANVFSSVCMQVGVTVGVSAGGVLVLGLGVHGTLILVAAFFVLSGTSIFSIAEGNAESTRVSVGKTSLLADYRAAARHLMDSKALPTVCAVLVLAFANMNFCNMALPIFVARDLAGSSIDFGMIDSAWGMGSIAGGFILPFVARRLGAPTLGLLGLTAMSGALVVLSIVGIPHYAAIVMFLMGCFNCIMRVSADTAILHTVAPAYYAKIKSLTLMLIAYLSLTIYGVVSHWGDALSMRWLYRIDAMLLTVFVAVALAFLLRRRIAEARSVRSFGPTLPADSLSQPSSHD
jgi:MFS transporter, DHA3 family, macrolide efflux protein